MSSKAVQKNENKTRPGDVKLSLFIDHIIVYFENPRELIKITSDMIIQ